MCLSLLAQMTMGAGAGLSAYGSYQQGKESRRLHGQRAAAAESEAVAIGQASLEKQRLLEREKGRTLSTQRQRYAKAGVRTGTGTPLIVAAATAAEYAREKAVIGAEGARGASRARQRAGFERDVGASKYRAGLYGAAGSLLGGATNITSLLWQEKMAKKQG